MAILKFKISTFMNTLEFLEIKQCNRCFLFKIAFDSAEIKYEKHQNLSLVADS